MVAATLPEADASSGVRIDLSLPPSLPRAERKSGVVAQWHIAPSLLYPAAARAEAPHCDRAVSRAFALRPDERCAEKLAFERTVAPLAPSALAREGWGEGNPRTQSRT